MEMITGDVTDRGLAREVEIDLAHTAMSRYRDRLEVLLEAFDGQDRLSGPEVLSAAFDADPMLGALFLTGCPLLVDELGRSCLRAAVVVLRGVVEGRLGAAVETLGLLNEMRVVGPVCDGGGLL